LTEREFYKLIAQKVEEYIENSEGRAFGILEKVILQHALTMIRRQGRDIARSCEAKVLGV
jgi:hypothetical protein